MGSGWNRVWFSVRTPNWSAAYAADTIKGWDTAEAEAEQIATLCRLGHLPADAVQVVKRARDRYNVLCYG